MSELHTKGTINIVEVTVCGENGEEIHTNHNDYTFKAWDIFLGCEGYTGNNVVLETSEATIDDILGQNLWVYTGDEHDFEFGDHILPPHQELIGEPLIEVEKNYQYMGNSYIRNTREFVAGYGEVDGTINSVGLKTINDECVTYLTLPESIKVSEINRVKIRYTTLFRDEAIDEAGEVTNENNITVGRGDVRIGDRDVAFEVTAQKYVIMSDRLVFMTGGAEGSMDVIGKIGKVGKVAMTVTTPMATISDSKRVRAYSSVVTIHPQERENNDVRTIRIPYGQHGGELVITFAEKISYPVDMAIDFHIGFDIVSNQENIL